MTETMYEKLGISKEVYEFGQTIEAGLKERFSQMDEVAEYNQLKVLHAMQEIRSVRVFQLRQRVWLQRYGKRHTGAGIRQYIPYRSGIGSSADYLWNARPCPCPCSKLTSGRRTALAGGKTI